MPRAEVIDELMAAVHGETAPLHDGVWARGTDRGNRSPTKRGSGLFRKSL
ncbi:oxidoreductase domain-containing protein [Burkholderia sp. SJ98]|nr:oxidoreductase domain-containing protein [Burkholderia sp. SJ98]